MGSDTPGSRVRTGTIFLAVNGLSIGVPARLRRDVARLLAHPLPRQPSVRHLAAESLLSGSRRLADVARLSSDASVVCEGYSRYIAQDAGQSQFGFDGRAQSRACDIAVGVCRILCRGF